MKNYMKLEIAAKSINEGFARSAVAAFSLFLNPSVSDLSDIKTAVSEAVTNAIVHAYYGKNGEDKIVIECMGETEDGYGGILHIKITDYGCGIEDIDRALVPFYTTLADEERSGMGFTIMQTFSDDFSLNSERGKGTVVELIKRVGSQSLCEGAVNREKERLNA
jgi:stage II sporulation protein AB (anti-sigma F factor)